MSHDYLIKEYELCFEQLRFYDERQTNTLKYLFSLTSAVATAQFAVYKLLQGPTIGFYGCQTFLSIIVFVATLLLYLSMLQNRMYFVYNARQLNAIRGFLMESAAGSFKNNQLYTATDFPALKPSSVHTFQMLGAALISSMFAGLSAFAIWPAVGGNPCVLPGIITFALVAIAEITGGIKYLSDTKERGADDVIHGKKISEPGH
jgi:hypothetical protein